MKSSGVSALLLALFATSAHAALLVQYNFDGGNANDTGTGTPANGTLIGANSGFTSSTPGGSGLAYSTGAGVNDYITTGTTVTPDAGPPAKLASLNAFTISMWVNLQAVPVLGDRLVSTWDGSNGIDFRINTASATNFPLVLSVDGATTTSANVTAPSTNTWLFLAVTYDGSVTTGNVRFYTGRTDVAAAQLGGVGNSNAGVVASTGGALQIGGTPATALDRSPSAFFDDVRIYDTVLTATELEAVRASNIPEPASLGLVGLSLLGLMARRRR